MFDWRSRPVIISSGLIAIYIITAAIAHPSFGFSGLMAFIGVSSQLAGQEVPAETAIPSPGSGQKKVVTPTKTTATPQITRVTSDTSKLSPSPVGVTSDTNSSGPIEPTSYVSSTTPQVVTPTPVATPIPQTVATSTATVTPAPVAQQSGKININTAGLSELDQITGVGPVIAQRIIDYRTANGPFQSLEEIKNVKYIGDKTFEKMKDEITVGN